MQEDLVREIHEALNHRGVAQVYQTLTQRWYFEQAYVKIKTYLQGCPVCLRTKLDKAHRRQPLHPVPIEPEVLRNWSADCVALPKSDSTGSSIALVCIDQVSRWIEVYPLQTADAISICKCLLDICSRYSVPATWRTDRGKAFLSTSFTELCKSLNIKTKTTASYMPRSDGQASEPMLCLFKV